MTIAERESGGVIVLDVHGRMTIEVEKTILAEKVRELLQQGHKHILVNLADVVHVDTSGLCDLVESYLAATRREGRLKFTGVTPRVRKVLEITKDKYKPLRGWEFIRQFLHDRCQFGIGMSRFKPVRIDRVFF